MPTDPIDDLPNIRLEKDDLESFHRSRGRGQSNNPKQSTSAEPMSEQSTKSTSGPGWVSVLFLFLLLAGAGVYWSLEQQKVLIQAQQRIAELENRLSATGEDMGQSTAAMQVQLSELSKKTDDLWEQMDKLWASAWRRNQSEIAALNKTVIGLKSSTDSSAKKLNASIADNNIAIAQLEEQIVSQTSRLGEISQQLGNTNKFTEDFEQQLASLREKLIATALANNDLTNQIDDLRRRIAANEKKTQQVENILTGPTS